MRAQPTNLVFGLLAFLILTGGIFILLRLMVAVVSALFGASRKTSTGSGPWARSDMENRRVAPVAASICPNELCRHPNVSAARFCAQCGTRLTFRS